MVCHLSPVQRLRDERAFFCESLPTVAFGLRPIIVGPHSQAGSVQGVELISTSKSKSRGWRVISAVGIMYRGVQKADLYHLHSPELIPVGLILKLILKKKIVYDTREDFPSMMLAKSYLPRWSRLAVSKCVAVMERIAAKFFDGVLTADAGTLRPLARTGRSKKLVLYNFPNLQYFPDVASSQKSYDLVYRGGLSERAGTLVLFEAMRLLLNRGIRTRLLLFGYFDNPRDEKCIRNALVD